jgi:hypothetical protein
MIIGLEEWNLTEQRLAALDQVATIRILFTYPHYRLFLDSEPAQRKKQIAQTLRRSLQVLRAEFSIAEYTLIGTRYRPGGIITQLPAKTILALNGKEYISRIGIEDLPGFTRTAPVPEDAFWGVKARFAIQVEGIETGMQQYEERIVLVKAADEESAKQKLLKSFEAYAEPYMSASGRLVRYQFEEFVVVYSVYVDTIDDFLSDSGVEVYSQIRSRRITPASVWKGEK